MSDASKIYAGCYCQAVVVAKAVKSGTQWFITLYLQAVRFVKDGESFAGAKVDVDDAFEDLGDEENDFDNYENTNVDDSQDDDTEDDDDFDI